MGTLFALLLIFGGFGAITGAIKSFAKGVQRGRAELRAEQESPTERAHREAVETE